MNKRYFIPVASAVLAVAMAGSAGDYYWSGAYGTYFWIDPKEAITVVFLSAAPGLIRLRYRQMLRNLVYQALTS